MADHDPAGGADAGGNAGGSGAGSGPPAPAGEFMDPTPEGTRWLSLMWGGAIAVGLIVEFFGDDIWHLLKETPSCMALPFRLAIVAATVGLLVAASMVVFSHAFRMVRYRQSPPPGSWVWMRSEVRRGRAPVIGGVLLMLVALAGLAIPVVAWPLFESLPLGPAIARCWG